MKTLLAYSQNMFPPPSILSILCLRGHLSEASQHSLSITPPKSAIQISRQCSVLPSKLRFVQLEVNNPVKLSLVDRFIQTSSREGRERSFHTSSSSKERSPLRPNSLYSRDDPFPVSKTGKSYSFPNRLLSYRMVHLGPVDTTTSITMIVEVLEHVSKSRVTVAILKFRRLEGRSNFFMIVFACGTFVNPFNVISSSVKLVSLSIYRCVGLMLVIYIILNYITGTSSSGGKGLTTVSSATLVQARPLADALINILHPQCFLNKMNIATRASVVQRNFLQKMNIAYISIRDCVSHHRDCGTRNSSHIKSIINWTPNRRPHTPSTSLLPTPVHLVLFSQILFLFFQPPANASSPSSSIGVFEGSFDENWYDFFMKFSY
ncbi:hypothetical protein YC2023_054098 [Brassica napus]